MEPCYQAISLFVPFFFSPVFITSAGYTVVHEGVISDFIWHITPAIITTTLQFFRRIVFMLLLNTFLQHINISLKDKDARRVFHVVDIDVWISYYLHSFFFYMFYYNSEFGSQEQGEEEWAYKKETLNSPFLFKEPRRMSGGIPYFLISNCSLLLCHITVVCVLCILILTVACKHVFALLLLRYTSNTSVYTQKKPLAFFSSLLYRCYTHTRHRHHQAPNIITCDPILKLNLTKWNIHVFRNNTCFLLSFTNDNNKRQICCEIGTKQQGELLKAMVVLSHSDSFSRIPFLKLTGIMTTYVHNKKRHHSTTSSKHLSLLFVTSSSRLCSKSLFFL